MAGSLRYRASSLRYRDLFVGFFDVLKPVNHSQTTRRAVSVSGERMFTILVNRLED